MAFAYYYLPYCFPAISYVPVSNPSSSDSASSSTSTTSTSSEASSEYVMCWPWTELKLEDPPAKMRKRAQYLVYPGDAHRTVYLVEPVDDGSSEAKRSKDEDTFTYIPRSEGDAHPPLLINEGGAQYFIPHAPAGQPMLHPVYHSTTASQVPQYAYAQTQYQQYVYPTGYQHAYQYPIHYNTSTMPAGTHVYYPQHGAAAFTPATYVATATNDAAPKADKKKSKKKKKSTTKSKSKHATHHGWHGRTAAEVFEDEIKTAAKDGVYGPRDIAPRDPKPSDMFWVIPCEPDERAKLITYYEIMDAHKPGKWQLGPDGYLRWHKEPKAEKVESSSGESSALEWEN